MPDDILDDNKLTELLKKLNAKMSLHGIYGLFYGCVAAPALVKPSLYMQHILDSDNSIYDSMEQAESFINTLMALWNAIARSQVEGGDMICPEREYPATEAGLSGKADDLASLVNGYMTGLSLGEAHEDDFTDDALDALKSLAEILVLSEGLPETLRKEHGSLKGAGIQETLDYLDSAEDIVFDCFNRIAHGLADARKRRFDEKRGFHKLHKNALQALSHRVPRNSPCPCGSGIKYKKCCGMTH